MQEEWTEGRIVFILCNCLSFYFEEVVSNGISLPQMTLYIYVDI